MKTLLRSLLSIAACVYTIAGLPAFALAILLLIQGETLQGRLFGLASILLFPVPMLLWLGTFPRLSRALRTGSIGLLIPALLLFATCYCMTPDGKSSPEASAASVFAGVVSYNRASLANLVPEIDQLKLGTYIFPWLDPHIDAARAIRIRRLFMKVYRDMQQSEDFNRLGSVMNYVYRDMFLDRRPTSHFYQYIPKSKENSGKLPVILFLHGSLGNFKGYQWVWKKFADAHGYAIVAPSFGQGNWYLPGGLDAIEQARHYCLNHPRLNGNRIYLAGLSNGGTGLTRAIAANGRAYAGFIFISPVIEDDIVVTPPFLAGCNDRRILVIHGNDDERIPASYVKQSLEFMKKQGVDITPVFYPAEDHFLLFSQPDQVLSNIAAWLEKKP